MKFALALLALAIPSAFSSTCKVSQIHINSGKDSSSSMVVSFLTPDATCASKVSYGLTASKLTSSSTNSAGCSSYSTTYKSQGSYTSACIHHVTIEGLSPSTTYYYTASGDSSVFSFKTAPVDGEGFPIAFAVLGDLGQTANSLSTIQHIQQGT